MASDEATQMGRVVGRNVARLRGERRWTQVELADQLAQRGSSWVQTNVAALESGRRQDITMGEIVMLCAVLNADPAALLEGDAPERVMLSVDASMDREGVRLRMVGGPKRREDPRAEVIIEGPTAAERFRRIGVDADLRLADRLGVDLEAVMSAAERRWGHSVTAERDERLQGATGDPRIVRGHITRALERELAPDIEKGK